MQKLTFSSPISDVYGIGEAKTKLFAKKNIFTVGDLLAFFPRTYEMRGDVRKLRDCVDGEVHSVEVTCTANAVYGKTYTGIEYVKMTAEDDTAPITVTFFGKRYLQKMIYPGRKYRLYGKIHMGLYGAESNTPEIERIFPGQPLPSIVPVYSLTSGMTQNLVRSTMKACLGALDGLPDVLPEAMREKHGLLPKKAYIEIMHSPKSADQLERAKRSASFEELLVLQLALRGLRNDKERTEAEPLPDKGAKSFIASLPFSPTGAQNRAMREIFDDLSKNAPMARLLQGDVGSGKTLVAAAAMERCVQNGKQCVLLAPTEILAEQHARTVEKWFSPLGIRVALLTAGIPKKQKNIIKAELQAGNIDVLIGTHAALQEDVAFSDLGLVVTDEQHRFGVRQRAVLLEKSEACGKRAHMLVMSATPIPRSLSLILYGDLDVSILDELPPGRQVIETFVMKPADRSKVYESIRRQLRQGGQAYIICPLIEENEETTKKAAESYFRELQEKDFSEFSLGLLHGKMSGKEKAEVMQAFASGQTKILVSTTVIEVGVDVPNANVMLIENAECFGLSQLHQLRGRIGRGSRKSYCVLMNDSGKDNERLNIMKETSDGFRIAEADLQQRGPGDFFGERQSGELTLYAAVLADMPLVVETRKELEAILPEIKSDAFASLRAAASTVIRNAGGGKTIN